MKIYSSRIYSRLIYTFILFIPIMSFTSDYLCSEESYLQEMEIDSSTKLDDNSSGLPNNPFEIVEMIRRANSLNDATKPSDAIDDALKSFDMIEQKEKI